MLPITKGPSFLADYRTLYKGVNNFYKSQAYSLSSSHLQSTDIIIMTSDGDTVTLSMDSERQINVLDYKELILNNDTLDTLHIKSSSLEINQELSVTVEGDLSVEELNDIQESLKMIDNLMQKVLSGNMGEALTMIDDIGSMESISGFSAGLTIENIVSVDKSTSFAKQASSPESKTGINQAGDINIPDSRFNRVVDGLFDGLKHRGVKVKKLINPLDRYFSELFEEIAGKHDRNEKDEKMEIARYISSKIMERMKREVQDEANNGNAGLENERAL